MSINLPGVLITFLRMIGYKFPEGQEAEILQWAQQWKKFSDAATQVVDAISGVLQAIRQENIGPAVEAFSRNTNASGSAMDIANKMSKAAKITATCLMIVGAVILVLKILMIVDLTTFAIQVTTAISSAAATFGASLASIPIFQAICKAAIQFGIEKATQEVLG